MRSAEKIYCTAIGIFIVAGPERTEAIQDSVAIASFAATSKPIVRMAQLKDKELFRETLSLRIRESKIVKYGNSMY